MINELNKFEYQKLYESMRFFLEYRLKVLTFSAIANGLLIAAVFTHAKEENGKIALSILACSVALVIYLIDVRIVGIAKMYRNLTTDLALALGLDKLSQAHASREVEGFSLNHLFKAVNLIVILCWVCILTFLLVA